MLHDIIFKFVIPISFYTDSIGRQFHHSISTFFQNKPLFILVRMVVLCRMNLILKGRKLPVSYFTKDYN